MSAIRETVIQGLQAHGIDAQPGADGYEISIALRSGETLKIGRSLGSGAVYQDGGQWYWADTGLTFADVIRDTDSVVAAWVNYVEEANERAVVEKLHEAIGDGVLDKHLGGLQRVIGKRLRNMYV